MIAKSDGHAFEELLTDFSLPFQVGFWDFKRRDIRFRIYSLGEDIVIPEYVVHWLINPNNQKLEFTCEYAPYPWDGDGDEPEFRNFKELMSSVSPDVREKLFETDLEKVLG